MKRITKYKEQKIVLEAELLYCYFRLEEEYDRESRNEINDRIIDGQLKYERRYGGYFKYEKEKNR